MRIAAIFSETVPVASKRVADLNDRQEAAC
jgi:hypothetical protein